MWGAAIDHALAAEQHRAYCQLLTDCGATVITLDVNRHLPDCAFVEDTAVVLDEIAVLTTMGAESRRAELPGIAAELRKHREVLPIELAGNARRGRRAKTRQNAFSRPIVAHAMPRELRSCKRWCALRLSGRASCSARLFAPEDRLLRVPDGRLHVNFDWIDASTLAAYHCVDVPHDEPWANIACIGENVIISADHPHSAERLSKLGFAVRPINVSEFAKAEAGVTCLSLLIG